MVVSKYNFYKEEENVNFQGLNMLSTVFSVLFCVLNCFIASLVIEDIRIKAVCTLLVFGILEYIIIDTSFVYGDLTSHSTMALALTFVYTLILIPGFGYI